VQINHRQPTEQGGEVDRDSWTSGRALVDAHEWLHRHGARASDGVTDQPAPRSSERPVDGTLGLSSSRHPPESSEPADDDINADVESVARAIALHKLTARARTRQELDQALRAKSVPQGVIDALLDRFQEAGLVDDASFAENWVSSRQRRRHFSRRLLRRELEAKGVEQSHIDNALDRVDRDAELTSARDLAERKHAAMNGLSREVQYRRLAGMLSRRGFDTAITTQVLADVLGE
jgi:regulatory protein